MFVFEKETNAVEKCNNSKEKLVVDICERQWLSEIELCLSVLPEMALVHRDEPHTSFPGKGLNADRLLLQCLGYS
ncbi:hypothetical protein BLOT_001758 [Blomia tropicalis]|nr:hypothetical protein BLOT_001758 [Blomia tropicalis]